MPVALKRVVASLVLLCAVAHCGEDDTAKVAPAPADAAAPSVPDAAVESAMPTPALEPTEPAILAGSSGKDEDPCLFRAADGTFYLLWYSNRDGNDRIWLQSSTDVKVWSEPRAITAPGDHVFYPSITQTADGRFHLVAWHGSVGDGGKIVGRIAYYSSADTKDWSAPAFLTDASALAWSPTIVAHTATELVATWSSDVTGDKEIYVARSEGGASWSAPETFTTKFFNDDLPFIAKAGDGSLVIVWQRYVTTATGFDAPFTHPSNDLISSASVDGKTWGAPIAITNDETIPDVIGSLYPRNDDARGFGVVWAGVRGTSGSGDISTMPLGAIPATATNVKQLTNIAGADYSARLIPAGPEGLYLMAWVSDRTALRDGGQNLDIWSQLIRIP